MYLAVADDLLIRTPADEENAAAAESPPMPLPSNPRSVFLGGIFFLALLTAMHAASAIILPIVLAFMIKLAVWPIQRVLEKIHIPRMLIAFAVLAVLICTIVGLGTMLTAPTAEWAEKLPAGIVKLQEKLGFLSHPIAEAQKIMTRAEGLTRPAGAEVVPVAIQGTRLSDRIIAGAKAMAGGLFTTMLILFFLVATGDTFLRRLVEVLPRFKDKRQAVDISQQIEQHISTYLLTITVMNAAVGIATGIVMRAFGLPDPLLWATLAFLLNYIPLIGPLVGMAIFLLVGMLSVPDGAAFLPALCYLLVHLVEGTLITPLLVAKRFTLNPVLVILSLVFWYWMWGVPGAILAMPILAIAKIICDRIQPLTALGHFLAG